jgi:chemotaxis protein MotB
MAMSKKKHKHDEEHMDESWLIPYADLLTLLLALFIVLFAMSSIDAQKFAQMSKSFQSTFNGGTGVIDYPSPVLPPTTIENLDPVKEPDTAEQEELKLLQKKIDSYIRENDLELELKTILTDEGLLITILNDVLFSSGSAEVRASDKKLLKGISELLLMEEQRNIIVSGHTDNIPIRNSVYHSNWHLSVMRAVNFMSVLIDVNDELDPRILSAKGYGEYKPVTTNDTADGRKKNRRVEILIKPNSGTETKF